MMFMKWGGTNKIYSSVKKRTKKCFRTNNGDYYNSEEEKDITGSLLSLEEFSGEQNIF